MRDVEPGRSRRASQRDLIGECVLSFSVQFIGVGVDDEQITRILARPWPREVRAEGSGDSGGVWQGGSAAAAAPSAPLDVDSIARQVLSMLQSQLRAERDRHQIYDR